MSRCKPLQHIEFLSALFRYGEWLREHSPHAHYDTRQELYDVILSMLADRPFDFLEFGVFKGDSLLYWSSNAANPRCRFFGFDTFTGLPEVWQTGIKAIPPSAFDVHGQAPHTDDPRVAFVKGLFQETIPCFLKKNPLQKDRVFHFDADLYSSTLFALCSLNFQIIRDSILLFDNFSVATHDFRAFTDWCSSFRRKFHVIATAEIDFEKVAIKIDDDPPPEFLLDAGGQLNNLA